MLLFGGQIYEDGRMGAHLKEWVVGATAEWRGPLGDFSYTPNTVLLRPNCTHPS